MGYIGYKRGFCLCGSFCLCDEFFHAVVLFQNFCDIYQCQHISLWGVTALQFRFLDLIVVIQPVKISFRTPENIIDFDVFPTVDGFFLHRRNQCFCHRVQKEKSSLQIRDDNSFIQILDDQVFCAFYRVDHFVFDDGDTHKHAGEKHAERCRVVPF